jgi:hypothetical protein
MSDETDLYLCLGRIEGKIDAIHIRQETQAADITAIVIRVTQIEKRMAWWAGGAAAVGALIGYVIQLLKLQGNS